MYYYILPGVGIYGGIKKAFQCVDFLTSFGLTAKVATPDGETASWLYHSACAVAREFALGIPAARRIVHMQGANTSADRELIGRYPQFDFISHGHHMSVKLCEQGIVAPYVPNSVSAVFEAGSGGFDHGVVAVMPRKGADVIAWLMDMLGDSVDWCLIDGQTERQTAELLKAADVFLAISSHEAFGLPVVEAMAAGCCVVGFPGDGGYEFMHHGASAHVVANGDKQGLLDALVSCLDNPEYRENLRRGGARVASFYTPARERACLYSALRWLGCV